MYLVKEKEGERSMGRSLDLSGTHVTLSQISPPKGLSAPGCIFQCQVGLPNLCTPLWRLKNQGILSCLFQGNVTSLAISLYQGRV